MTEQAIPGDAGLDKDLPYAERFWQRQPEGMREVMIENINEYALVSGLLTSFVNINGIDEKDREKLSAYRALARELGYEVGEYVFYPRDGIAAAPIRKPLGQGK